MNSSTRTPQRRPWGSYLFFIGLLATGLVLLWNRLRGPSTPDTDFAATPSAPVADAAPISVLPASVAIYDAPPSMDVTLASVAPAIPFPETPVTVALHEDEEAGRPVNWGMVAYEFAETILLTALIFFSLQAVMQNYRIEGQSMEPNLHEGQHLVVNKVAYIFGEPQRGDVIVFEFPNSDPDAPKDYIKRVIGVPGDTIECNGNQLLVNGQPLDESTFNPNALSLYTCSTVTLQEDQYYAVGDNRPNSSDSRSWGILERKFIIGKAEFAYWPFPQAGRVPNVRLLAPPAVAAPQ